jgi:hypothetical protein
VSAYLGSCRFAPFSESERRAVPDGLDTIWEGRLYRESFGDCWIARPASSPATVRLSHDGPDVGTISVVVAHGKWHVADFVIPEGPLQARALERIRPGAPVSLEAESLRRYEDTDLRIVRHSLAKLNHIALVGRDEIAGHVGAVVTAVRELKSTKPAGRAQPVAPKKPAVDLAAYLTSQERVAVANLEREGLHPATIRELVEGMVRPRMAKGGLRCPGTSGRTRVNVGVPSGADVSSVEAT